MAAAKKKAAKKKGSAPSAPARSPRRCVTNIGRRTIFTDTGPLRPGETGYCDRVSAQVLYDRGDVDFFGDD